MQKLRELFVVKNLRQGFFGGFFCALASASAVVVCGAHGAFAAQSVQPPSGSSAFSSASGDIGSNGALTNANRQANYAKQTGFASQSGRSQSIPGMASTRYNIGNRGVSVQAPVTQVNDAPIKTTRAQKGFSFDAGLSYEFAMWQFNMNESGSILHYDNVNWLVLDAGGHYKFGGTVPIQIDAGVKYGIQATKSTMIDDDVSNGGFDEVIWGSGIPGSNYVNYGTQKGHVLSLGATSGGSIFGYNVGLGITDFYNIRGVKITPSLGYRHFAYTLKTTNNYGLSVDTAACFVDDSGETQCDPAIILYNANGVQQIIWRFIDGVSNGNQPYDGQILTSSYTYLDWQNTYYFEQPGTSHKYDVSWTGPYLALDMGYDINNTNYVTGRMELGLPAYTATGDQPYRFDWQHPKSVEDSGSIGDAWHAGFGAQWTTALTDSVNMTLGFTFDYYSVSGANAKTYLNGDYYEAMFNTAKAKWGDAGLDVNDLLNPDYILPDLSGENKYQLQAYKDLAMDIIATKEDCPGWVCESKDEIESFYKSLGIRVGLNARF